MRIMNGLTPETEWKPRCGGRSVENALWRCTLQSNRPPERSFSLRFGGQSVHNAHLLCSCIWGNWCVYAPLRSAPGFHVRGVNRGGMDNGNQLLSSPLGGRGRTGKDERCSAGTKFYTRPQHACAVGTSRAISSAHRRVTLCVWRHLAQNLSVSRSLKIQAAGGESGAKQRSTSHVRHIETSLTLKNRTVALCGVFSADVLAYRLTQNILQYVGWWRFEAARDWCVLCDVIQVWRVQPRFRLRVAEQRYGFSLSFWAERERRVIGITFFGVLRW